MNGKDFWINDAWDKEKGRSISIKIKSSLESCRSEFQQIDVYESECFGRLLALDNIIMLTEADEFAYHEMISHVALNVHPDPRRVLIIGGGDGGTAREVLKHDVEEVHLCEIDREVIRVSIKYFPTISTCFDDQRMKVVTDDGAEYIKGYKDFFDLVIVDSSDPIGPARVLFAEEFYNNIHDSLTEDGIAVTQSESMFYDKGLIKDLFVFNKRIFPIVRYFYTLVPTYPSGTIGFSFCSKKYDPVKDMHKKIIPDLRYYNYDIHKAAFMLPNFINQIVG
ncbi:MAG: polyamine aminopropyltransferase [Deltaproteobacteria bacterium]|nr:polyamine aminopropyltransferase [Deltaproteobacteria bacterium]